MRNHFIGVVVGLFGLLQMTGCAEQMSATAEPGVNMSQMRSYHIVRDKPDDVTTAIQKDLTTRGYTVTIGPDSETPPTADCKVESHVKWVWDMTMYPLEVKLELIQPKSGALLGSGRSYHTSLARKSPEYMVKEIFDKIYAVPTAKPG